MEKNTELLTMARKAVDAWNGTDTYHQAATIITMLVDELEKVYKEIECTSFSNSPLLKGDDIWYVDVDEGEIEHGKVFLATYKNGVLESISVDFVESEDFDEFDGSALGESLFIREEDAKNAILKGRRTL